MKKKAVIFTLIFLISILVIFSTTKISNVANMPKYQNIFWSNSFNFFMKLPDPIKSSFMIFSGKRNFSNLFNDYNVKFLPETQYINLDFIKKDINFKKANRHTFYIDVFSDELIFVTKDGNFFRSKIDNLKDDSKKLKFEKIKVNNFYNELEKEKQILDILVIKDEIFITTPSKYEECSKLEIKVSKIKDNLNFKTFKLFNECIEIKAGAGRIKEFYFNNKSGLLVTTLDGDNDAPGKKAQKDSSIFGKIIFVDLETQQHEVFSKGHRNAQGLYVLDDKIFSTEHGPRGGDELNRIFYNKNYGWPIASYGNSYNKKDLVYKKSHKDNSFEEPLHVFLPSIGISELIALPNQFNENWKNNLIISSLNGRSLYRVKFDSSNFDNILYTEKIYIGERIRDIKYLDELNIIILALERTGSIGIIKNID